jgi:hypothetical protein
MTLSKANTIAKIVGLYQIIGAVTGLWICCYSLYNYQVNLFWWLYLFITILLQPTASTGFFLSAWHWLQGGF